MNASLAYFQVLADWANQKRLGHVSHERVGSAARPTISLPSMRPVLPADPVRIKFE